MEEFNTFHKRDDRVVVETYDWWKDKPDKIRLSGRILNYVEYPRGYNIKLDEKKSFYGNIPFPIGIPMEVNKLNIRNFQETDAYVLDIIFVREWMITSTLSKRIRFNPTEEVQNVMLANLKGFYQTLIFRLADAMKLAEQKPQYIKYYKEDGSVEVLETEREVRKEIGEEADKRLVQKHSHFFGFTLVKKLESYIKLLEDTQLHFSDNRYCNIDDGCCWLSNVEKHHAICPKKGTIICGIASRRQENLPPSFDRWFCCSTQFLFLWRLIVYKTWPENILKMSVEQILEQLIIPENEVNFFVRHETPTSRYLYAAIFLLIIRKEEKLPEEWNLPKKYDPIRKENVPFEVWWKEKCLLLPSVAF